MLTLVHQKQITKNKSIFITNSDKLIIKIFAVNIIYRLATEECKLL